MGKLSNYVIGIVLFGAAIALLSQVVLNGVNNYNIEVDPEFQATLDELEATTTDPELESIKGALSTNGSNSLSDDPDAAQYSQSLTIGNKMLGAKSLTIAMVSSIGSYLKLPTYIVSTILFLVAIGFIGGFVYLVWGRKP